MRCTVYRSLDKPSAFFGIRGRFTTWFAVFGGVALMLGLVAGMMTDSIVGIVTFLIGAAVDYLVIMSLQGKSSDREFAVKIQSRRHARFISVPAMALRHLWRGDRG